MSNEYVFQGFWESLTEDRFDWENWERKHASKHSATMCRSYSAQPASPTHASS